MVRAFMTMVALAAAVAAAAAADTATFTLRALPGRPGIDGRAWMFVKPYTGSEAVVRPAGADYDLRFAEREDVGGVARWTVTLDRGSQHLALTREGKTRFVYVTPDARYAIIEPLTVVDAKTGERYALDLAPPVTIVAISQDGRRLFVERGDGEPFELTLPQ